jgi:tRNA A37 threonylcarbamoyladenosine biosynthesis protein TsaE
LHDPAGVIAIEWGAIVESVLPKKRLLVTITSTGEETRDFTFEYPAELDYLIPQEIT